MRIETWNLKKGDLVIIHFPNGIILSAEISKEPYEFIKDLLLTWKTLNNRGIAIFDEDKNHWHGITPPIQAGILIPGLRE